MTAAARIGRVTSNGTDPLAPRFRFLDLAEIKNQPPVEWLIEDVLPANALAEVHAPPESAKSFAVLDMMMCIGSNRRWHGKQVRAGAVVYVVGEGSPGMGARVAAWEDAHDCQDVARVSFVTEPLPLLQPDDVGAFIVAVCALPERPAVIVLDTLALCMAGGDENSAKDMGLAIASAKEIQKRTGATVILVHHTRKDGETERGSTALRGAMDVMIALKREKDDPRVTVLCDKMKDAAHFAPLFLELTPHAESCVLITAGEALQSSPLPVTGKQREALASLHSSELPNEGLSASKWEKVSGLPERTFYQARKVLVALGYVEQTGRGRGSTYHTTPEGAGIIAANCNLPASPLHCSDRTSLPASASLLGEAQHGSDWASAT